MMPVRLEPGALGSRVKHSTTEPLCSLLLLCTTCTALGEVIFVVNLVNKLKMFLLKM